MTAASGMTRRALLAATAGAMAGGLLRPRGTIAALLGPPPAILSERRLGALRRGATTIDLPGGADLVGLEWQGPAAAGVWLRFRRAGGGWSRWVAAGPHGHRPDARSATGRSVGEPIWTGGASTLEIHAARALGDVRLHLVDVSAGIGASRQAAMVLPLALAASLPRAAPVLAAGGGQPPIIARRAWARGMAPPRVAPAYGAVRMAFVHHTENPNGYGPGEVGAMLRAIYAFHRYVNGWNDIGYNFVLDLYGRIFEARAGGIDEPVIGAHAGGYNLASSGVAVLGSFSGAPISAAARRSLQRLLAWKLALHGAPAVGSVIVRVNPAGAGYSRFPANARVSLPRIAGHRDGDSTNCPGEVLYGELPAIRQSVLALAGRPSRLTLAFLAAPPASPAPPAPPAPPAQGAPPAPASPSAASGTLSGSLALLDGTPIAGARVAVQARSVSSRGELVRERTLAETTTDSAGRFGLSAGLSPGGGPRTWLRALSFGGGGSGACVSDPLRLAGAVSLSGPPAPAPTAPAAPPPGP
jgi:hypothetical protein